MLVRGSIILSAPISLAARSAYSLEDMAKDTIGLLDALGLGQTVLPAFFRMPFDPPRFRFFFKIIFAALISRFFF